MSIGIDKKVPMPEGITGKKKYPFPDMEVGDSFWADVSSERLSNATGHWRDKLGHKYAVRAETNEDGTEGARVWRTA